MAYQRRQMKAVGGDQARLALEAAVDEGSGKQVEEIQHRTGLVVRLGMEVGMEERHVVGPETQQETDHLEDRNLGPAAEKGAVVGRMVAGREAEREVAGRAARIREEDLPAAAREREIGWEGMGENLLCPWSLSVVAMI